MGTFWPLLRDGMAVPCLILQRLIQDYRYISSCERAKRHIGNVNSHIVKEDLNGPCRSTLGLTNFAELYDDPARRSGCVLPGHT